MNTHACDTCANKDSAFVLHGNKYVEETICLYGMQNFPKMAACDKYDNAYAAEDNAT